MSAPAVSVIVRCKNEEAAIAETLSALRKQTIQERTQVIVVDSGSTDRTLAIAGEFDVELIEIPASSFTFGGSLNVGCERAHAPLLVALSAHALPTDAGWLERMIAGFDDPRVACACGYDNDPSGGVLREPLLQDFELASRIPEWGYSNAAGGFRAELWRQRPFRADMPGCEDKEWAWHWLEQGWRVLIDPRLGVDHDHGADPPLELYRRARREHHGLGMFVPGEPQTFVEMLAAWWREDDGRPSALRARLSPRRLARLFGAYRGSRIAGRRL